MTAVIDKIAECNILVHGPSVRTLSSAEGLFVQVDACRDLACDFSYKIAVHRRRALTSVGDLAPIERHLLSLPPEEVGVLCD